MIVPMRSDSLDLPVRLRIVRGTPTLEELAVLTTVVGAAGEPPPTDAPRGRWNDPRYGHRRDWPVGPDGWRTAR
jgi:hypothetical protein